MRRELRGAAALLVGILAATCLIFTAGASAHTLSEHDARSAALKAGRKIGKATGAYKTRLSGCRRRSSHRINCKVENIYSSGSENCTTDIEVRFTSSSSSRVTSKAHRTLCF